MRCTPYNPNPNRVAPAAIPDSKRLPCRGRRDTRAPPRRLNARDLPVRKGGLAIDALLPGPADRAVSPGAMGGASPTRRVRNDPLKKVRICQALGGDIRLQGACSAYGPRLYRWGVVPPPPLGQAAFALASCPLLPIFEVVASDRAQACRRVRRRAVCRSGPRGWEYPRVHDTRRDI